MELSPLGRFSDGRLERGGAPVLETGAGQGGVRPLCFTVCPADGREASRCRVRSLCARRGASWLPRTRLASARSGSHSQRQTSSQAARSPFLETAWGRAPHACISPLPPPPAVSELMAVSSFVAKRKSLE